jgi:uridylate kinase
MKLMQKLQKCQSKETKKIPIGIFFLEDNMIPKYSRVLLKISGEALAGLNGFGIDESVLSKIVNQIAKVHDAGVEIGIVVGGGNFWRGRQGGKMDRTTADHMGMLATVINALAMQDALERAGVMTRVQTALDITKVAEPFIARRANRHLEKGRVVIFGCGTGSPFFTTDTAAALRANEIHAQALLLAKNIDGVYDSDPRKNPSAQKFDTITPKDYIEKGLSVMDTAAVSLCSENDIPIIAFGLAENDSIMRVVCGEKIGTRILS